MTMRPALCNEATTLADVSNMSTSYIVTLKDWSICPCSCHCQLVFSAGCQQFGHGTGAGNAGNATLPACATCTDAPYDANPVRTSRNVTKREPDKFFFMVLLLLINKIDYNAKFTELLRHSSRFGASCLTRGRDTAFCAVSLPLVRHEAPNSLTTCSTISYT